MVPAAPAGADTPGPPRRPPALAAAGRGRQCYRLSAGLRAEASQLIPLGTAAQHGEDYPLRAVLGRGCEQLVHCLRAGGQHGPQLLAVDNLSCAGGAVPGQPGDLLDQGAVLR